MCLYSRLVAFLAMAGSLVGVVCSTDYAQKHYSIRRNLKHSRDSMHAPTNCMATPNSPDCANYHYPYTEDNLQSLCASMPKMSGCSLRNACKNGGAEGSMCDPFALLADICGPMKGMMACMNYTKMCGEGVDSAIEDCSKHAASASLPASSDAEKNTISSCKQMPAMDGCASCTTSSCSNPLRSYAAVCMSMPSMSQCDSWKAFCRDAHGDAPGFCPPLESSGAYCSGQGSVMWNGFGFYYGSMEPCIILLFNGIVISKAWQYWFSIVGIVASGVLFQALTIARRLFLKKFGQQIVLYSGVETLLFMIQQGWSYVLMFLGMTYRMDYFIAVVLGLGLGRLWVIIHKYREQKLSSNKKASTQVYLKKYLEDDANTACCCNDVETVVAEPRRPSLAKIVSDKLAETQTSGQDSDVVKLKVDDMMCMANCGKTVRTALMNMEGVSAVNIDMDSKFVVVRTNLEADQLIEAIEDVGFDAIEMDSPDSV